MKRSVILAMAMALVLAGCGGGAPRDARRAPVPIAAPVASGPISSACMASGREARSGPLCGCIQAAANQTLSPAEQRRATAFYTDPQLAQDIRQSDSSADERFWQAYGEYTRRAEQLCG